MKKTLLIAAAALVAGIVSSEAQVYSVNIVGYVNVVCPAGSYVSVANPLDLDGVNNVTNVMASATKGTSILTWNGAGFSSVTRSAISGNWPAGAATLNLPPGTGFLVKAGASSFTNTFVGNVIPNVPGQTSIPLTNSLYSFVGSTAPFAGQLTDTGTNTLNLGVNLAKGSSVLVWPNGAANWVTATKSAINGNWNNNLTISVGEGMLIHPAGSSNWVQNLQ
jgi:hypothetical protein